MTSSRAPSTLVQLLIEVLQIQQGKGSHSAD